MIVRCVDMQPMRLRSNTEPIVHVASQMAAPTIKPIDTARYECKQSNYACCPELPMRAMLCGPSGCGKSVVLQNMVLDVFRGCFSRVYIFSPSIDIDQTWDPVKKYIKDEIKPDPAEKMFFNTYE